MDHLSNTTERLVIEDKIGNNFRTSVGVAVDRHTKNKKFQTKKWMLVMKTMLSYDEVTIQ